MAITEIHATTLSAQDGSYNFDFVPNGTYTLTAQKFGFEPSDRSGITVSDDDVAADLTIKAIPTYAVSGRVVDPEGNAIAGAGIK